MQTIMEKPKANHPSKSARRHAAGRRPRQHSDAYTKSPARYRPNHRSDSKAQQPRQRRGVDPSKTVPAQERRVVHRAIRTKPSKLQQFFRPFTIEKSLTLLGFTVGTALAVLFAIDLIFAWPFMKASVAFDVTFMLSGLTMLALSGNVAKDQIRGQGRAPSFMVYG